MPWRFPNFARALLFGVGLSAAGCGTVLLNQPIERKAKEWTIVVNEVRDGPNSYSRGGSWTYKPPDDHRFLWISMTIRNDAAQKRTFNYHRCDVDDRGDRILPALVDKDAAIAMLADEEEELEPGEQISRQLAFPYPEDRLPTRLSCGELVFELPLKTGRAATKAFDTHGASRAQASRSSGRPASRLAASNSAQGRAHGTGSRRSLWIAARTRKHPQRRARSLA